MNTPFVEHPSISSTENDPNLWPGDRLRQHGDRPQSSRSAHDGTFNGPSDFVGTLAFKWQRLRNRAR